MKKLIFHNVQDSRASLALLILRVVFGVAMVMHGWGKIQNPMAWAGDNFPGFLQLLAAVAEFGGGIAWIIGCLVPLASFGLFCTMAMAVYVHAVVKGDPFIGGSELAVIYLAFAIAIVISGPGKYSVDSKIFNK